MEFEIPKWLTKEYLQNALQNGKDYKVTIEDLKIDMPIAKGNNYVCDIFRCEIQYRVSNDYDNIQSKSLIVKAPKSGQIYEEMAKFGMLDKEPKMYNQFSPKLKSILRENHPSEEYILAESYFSTEENVLILEDLRPKGYKMADRLQRLDYDHCVLALKALAKFHAGSVKLFEEDVDLIKEVGRIVLFNKDLSGMFEKMFESVIQIFIDAIRKNPQLEKYCDWFEKNCSNFFNKIACDVEPRENEFNVLNHGDFWVTNMLFKYDNNNLPVDVKLIDLQVSQYTTPAIDLIYFIDASVQEEIRFERIEDLIEVYLKELNSNLEKYGSTKRLERSEFNETLKRHSHFRIHVDLSILPVCLADPNTTEIIDMAEAKMEDFNTSENNPMKGYLTNETYMKILSKRLEEFERIGLITARNQEMEFETPKWLTKEYLQTALDTGKDYKVTIEDFKIDMPIAKGNNYVCDIFRSDLQYRMSNDYDNLQSKSLIIKAPKSGPMYEEMLKFGIFQKEPKMYNQFSPKLKSILKEHNPNEEYILPESFFSPEENVLILEDLKTMGYKMADRLQRFDYDHCVLALKALAKFHAGSVRLYENEPDLIKDVGQEIFFLKGSNQLCDKYTVASANMFSEAIRKYPDLEKYCKWFEENGKDMYHTLTCVIEPKENEFNVLNHGDFWVTNMLFKYDDDNVPIDIKLIDLQVTRYTSPVIDFFYFIDASVQEEIKEEKTDDLIDVYLQELNSNLETYGCKKRLEKSEFYESLKKHAYFRIYVALSILPFVLADPNTTEILDMKEAKMEDFSSAENNPMKGYYTNETYIKIVSKRLEEYERLGLITSK